MTTGNMGPNIRRLEQLNRIRTWLFKNRRKLATGGIFLIAIWLGFHVLFAANGAVMYQKKKAEYRRLQQEIQKLQKENESISSQNKSLKTDPKTIEKEAREQLRYARPGEMIYVVPNNVQQMPPATTTAEKTPEKK